MEVAVATPSQPLTMTSREIAELTGKRHPDVKRDIEKMLKGLSEDVSRFARIYLDSMNRPQGEYVLDRDHTDCLLTGYSAIARMRVIKRWRELESHQAPALPSRIELAQMVIDAEHAREKATQEVDRLQGVCNTMAAHFVPGMTAPKFCKQLNGVNTQKVNAKLASLGLLRNERGAYVPTSYSRDQFFAEQQREVDGVLRCAAVITAKGAKWLYRAYLSNKLPMKACWDGKHNHLIFE